MKPTLQALEGPAELASCYAGSGLAAKVLGHSHATCRSGLALKLIVFITLTEKGIVSHGKEDTLSPVHSKIKRQRPLSRSSSRALDLQLRRRRLPS